jgi:signal transduction histidine kinase
LKSWWKEKRIDVYIAAVIIPSIILSGLTLWMLIRQYRFINYVLKSQPSLSLTEGAWLGNFSRISIFAFSMVIFSLLLILILGSFLSTQNMQKQLEVTRLKSEFVSTVSHELKTPLTSIRLLAERLLVLKPEEIEKQKEYLNLIFTQSYYLSHLIGNILDFSKIEEGRESYSFELVNLAELLRESIKNYPVKLIRADCTLEINIAPDLPLWYVDKEAISRVFINLLDNALKFSPASGVIKINAGTIDEGVFFEVIDQGQGIAEQDQEKIFERFYHTGKGTGIGLTLVRHITEGHKGRVELESKIGKGSTFRIILPKCKKY